MNITTQSIRFATESHTTSIYLSRFVWHDQTKVEFIRDGWFVFGQIETFESMAEALTYGLSVIKDNVNEDLTSIHVEVSSEMLARQDILKLLGESGFQTPAVNFV